MSPRPRASRAAGLEEAAGDGGARGLGRVEPDDKAVAAITAAGVAAAALNVILERQNLGVGLSARGESDIAIVVPVVDITVDMDVITARRHVAIKGAARLRHAGGRAVQADIGL